MPPDDERRRADAEFRPRAPAALSPPACAIATVSLSGVVGGDSPSIPHTNKGRALLRKLGWRPGQGVGPRRGIVEPVTVIKRGRARGGLGS